MSIERDLQLAKKTIADYQTLLRYGSEANWEARYVQASNDRDALKLERDKAKQEREQFRQSAKAAYVHRDEALVKIARERDEANKQVDELKHQLHLQTHASYNIAKERNEAQRERDHADVTAMRKALRWYAQQDFGQRARSALGGSFGNEPDE